LLGSVKSGRALAAVAAVDSRENSLFDSADPENETNWRESEIEESS